MKYTVEHMRGVAGADEKTIEEWEDVEADSAEEAIEECLCEDDMEGWEWSDEKKRDSFGLFHGSGRFNDYYFAVKVEPKPFKAKHYYGENAEWDKWVEKTIQSDILFCASSLVEDLFKAEIHETQHESNPKIYFPTVYSIDEIENLYYTEDEDEPGYDEECAGDAREILEWWGVSKWLFEKLQELGECVYNAEQHDIHYWGRTCSGQSIALDPTLYDVKELLEQRIAAMAKG